MSNEKTFQDLRSLLDTEKEKLKEVLDKSDFINIENKKFFIAIGIKHSGEKDVYVILASNKDEANYKLPNYLRDGYKSFILMEKSSIFIK